MLPAALFRSGIIPSAVYKPSVLHIVNEHVQSAVIVAVGLPVDSDFAVISSPLVSPADCIQRHLSVSKRALIRNIFNGQLLRQDPAVRKHRQIITPVLSVQLCGQTQLPQSLNRRFFKGIRIILIGYHNRILFMMQL